MIKEDIIKEFEATDEYRTWQESLLAIIGYITDDKNDDQELADELMADHLNASLQLGKGLEKAKYNSGKKLNEQFQEESRGE